MKFDYAFNACGGDCDECTVAISSSRCRGGDVDWEYEVDFADLREAVIELAADTWNLDKDGLEAMVGELDDLVDMLADYFEDGLKEHFEDAARDDFHENYEEDYRQ